MRSATLVLIHGIVKVSTGQSEICMRGKDGVILLKIHQTIEFDNRPLAAVA